MSQQTFIYGDFRYPPTAAKVAMFGRLDPFPGLTRVGEPSIGIEVLREFGALELRGKIYSWQVNGWAPMQPGIAESQVWYQVLKRFSKNVVFEMRGSGVWDVQYFRQESDANGAYMGVALKYLPGLPEWFVKLRNST
jgi:hypothetical protein